MILILTNVNQLQQLWMSSLVLIYRRNKRQETSQTNRRQPGADDNDIERMTGPRSDEEYVAPHIIGRRYDNHIIRSEEEEYDVVSAGGNNDGATPYYATATPDRKANKNRSRDIGQEPREIPLDELYAMPDQKVKGEQRDDDDVDGNNIPVSGVPQKKRPKRPGDGSPGKARGKGPAVM